MSPVDDLVAWLTQTLDMEEAGWRGQVWQEKEGVTKPLFHFGQPLTSLMLSKIAADRQILAACQRVYRTKDPEYGDGSHDLADEICALLAQPYADHPGFQEAWRVS